jgi:SAM-dependent methyltransferase
MDEERQLEFERRLKQVEARHDALRAFIVPALWNALDRLYAVAPRAEVATCLACAFTAPDEAFAKRNDLCVFGGGRLERLECPQCGCVFGPRKYLETPPDLVGLDYALLYSFYSEADSTDAEIRAFRSLNPTREGVYLNWGSGAWSSSVERLRAEGFDVWGYEPFANVDRPFTVRRREEIGARFDGLFSNNLIEHLFDPFEQFCDYRRVLKPNGLMAHASPCFSWSYAFTRFHVFFPLSQACLRLAERTGFDLVDAVDDGDFRLRLFRARTEAERFLGND